MRQTVALLIPLLLLRPIPAKAWGNEGHEIVARIAARHLTPAAQARVAGLLEVENNPQAVAEALAAAAIWADQVKKDTATESWHFLDLAWQDDRSNIKERCANDDCVTARIRLFADQLRANDPDADTRFEDADALRFLVHFVGDVHQPLHAATDADRGGNCEAVEGGVVDAANVHALWDSALVMRLGADGALLAAELDAEIGDMTEGQRGDFSAGEVEDWAWESHRLAMVNVYKRLNIPKEDAAFPDSCNDAPEEIQQTTVLVDDKYVADMEPVVREQLKKAGLRLARVLNEILG